MTAVRWKGTPNFTPGRQGHAVDRLVIHYIVGTLPYADSTFAQESSQVSAHYGVGEGQIHQYVQETDTAWHAGNFQVNLRSIGIEHSADQNRPPSASTYRDSAQLCARLCRKYGLDPRRDMHPHREYFNTLCPGTLDLARLIDMTDVLMVPADSTGSLGG